MTRVANEVLRTDDSLGGKAASAQHRLFMGHDRGDFSATYLAWPAVYGPRQSRPHDWAIVRRMLDGRPSFVIADGGLKLESRGFVANLVHAVLLVVDRPEASAGKKFIVADTDTFSMRQRIDFIADCLGHEWELVDAPYPVARPCHPLWRFRRDHQLRDTYEIRAELGYRDVVSVAEGLCRTVAYLLDNRPSPAVEDGIGETFAYPEEDRLVASIKRGATVSTDYPLGEATHGYDHPRGT
jgi:nucleoside-diphosphate-sugar epimerase